MKAIPQTIFLVILSLLVCWLGFNYLFITSLGFSFSIYVFLEFTKKLGREVPLKEFITLIAASQWIIGAKIGYNIGKVHYKYYMYVDEASYMYYVVPGVFIFYIGLNTFQADLRISNVIRFIKDKKEASLSIAKSLFIAGLCSFLISNFFRIPSIAFLFYLGNLLIYVSVIHFMILFPKRKWLIFFATVSFFFFFSLGAGFFHDLIITASFLLFFIFSNKSSFIAKLSFLLIGFSSMYVLQLVKGEYRQIIWSSTTTSVNPIETFISVLEKEFAPANPIVYTVNLNKNQELEEQTNINTRLNQGWIISKIMDNVPQNQEYLKGKTIIESIEASILPRFLFPNKMGANDALVNFRKITGIEITKGTSMGLSIIGEFYANYGQVGGCLAMFVYGLFLALFIKVLQTAVAGGSPLILLWLIFFFFQVVKAETDFIKIFNHLIKSFLFFIALQFVMSIVGFDLLLKNKLQGE